MGDFEIDRARLERALDRHSWSVPHYEAYDEEGQITSCRRYCGPDIARWYADPTLMEPTDAEAAAEEATWD